MGKGVSVSRHSFFLFAFEPVTRIQGEFLFYPAGTFGIQENLGTGMSCIN